MLYESLSRAALTALALTATAWVLLIAMGRELVEVPIARGASSPVLVHTLADTHAGLRQGRHNKHVQEARGRSVRGGRRGGTDAG